MAEKLKLPIGIQTFEEIRVKNYLYVDKTEFIYNMINNGKAYFLARPRRFGKSLTISTLDAIFSGRKDLFAGLFISQTDYSWEKFPIIRLDMSKVITNEGLDVLRQAIALQVFDTAKKYNIEIDENLSGGLVFGQLIRKLHEKFAKKVVVLVDEYDKPYLDFVDNAEKADEIRDILRGFYTQIKASDEYTQFVFLTGISKFAKMGVFSALNNLADISMSERYGTICGYTEDELEKYFPEYITETAEKFGISDSELLEKVEKYYDGFCFDGISRLYNPFSTLNFFDEKRFNNYWIKSGTPSFIAKYMKDRHLTVEQFRHFGVSQAFADCPGAIESSTAESFLYQSGYLTLRESDFDDYELDYPNEEVLVSMSELLSRNIVGEESYAGFRESVLEGLKRRNKSKLAGTLNRLLISIPYDDFAGAAKRAIDENAPKIKLNEWLYRSTLLAFFRGCGLNIIGEMHNNQGRADITVFTKWKETWLIEIKVTENEKDADNKLQEAASQVEQKNYAKQYENSQVLCLVIDDSKKQITKWNE